METVSLPNGKKISVTEGDITKIKTDAIVNAANTTLLGGGGVDGAIHRAAGPELLQACIPLDGCETGKAKITPAFRLPAKYVIHTPGPVWHGGNRKEAALLESCYQSCLELAERNGCRSVSFPSISTGVYAYPVDKAARIAVSTIRSFLTAAGEKEKSLTEVTLVCFDSHTCHAYITALQLLTEH